MIKRLSLLLFLLTNLECYAAENFLGFKKKYNLMSAAKEKMQYAIKRQMLLAENISSQDVPRYRAKDLESFDQISKSKMNNRSVAPIGIFATSKNHIHPAKQKTKYRIVKDKWNTNTSIMQNNVDISEQMVKVTENMNEYNLSTAIYKQMNGLIKIAIATN